MGTRSQLGDLGVAKRVKAGNTRGIPNLARSWQTKFTFSDQVQWHRCVQRDAVEQNMALVGDGSCELVRNLVIGGRTEVARAESRNSERGDQAEQVYIL